MAMEVRSNHQDWTNFFILSSPINCKLITICRASVCVHLFRGEGGMNLHPRIPASELKRCRIVGCWLHGILKCQHLIFAVPSTMMGFFHPCLSWVMSHQSICDIVNLDMYFHIGVIFDCNYSKITFYVLLVPLEGSCGAIPNKAWSHLSNEKNLLV